MIDFLIFKFFIYFIYYYGDFFISAVCAGFFEII